MATRREALAWIGGGALATVTGCRGRPAVAEEPDALDHALRELQRREPMARGGLSSHASMVAETLCELGAPDEAVTRVEQDHATWVELPPPRERIVPARWVSALGRTPDASSWERSVARFGDWREYFTAALAEDAWRTVVATWLPRLVPGAAAAATHGAIRTAHAVRALERRESEPRIAELARALAYWAASYQELPIERAAEPIATSWSDALSSVPLWADAHAEAPRGNIVAGLDAAAGLPGFARASGLAVVASDPDRGFAALVGTGARLYLRHGTRRHTIAFVHAVTGPCALWRLLPSMPAASRTDALGRAWQLVAAIHAAYARRDDPDPTLPSETLAPDDLAERAVRNGDDHAIKLTEALLWAHARHPDPTLLAAATRAVG